jgi:hypothetical protein
MTVVRPVCRLANRMERRSGRPPTSASADDLRLFAFNTPDTGGSAWINAILAGKEHGCSLLSGHPGPHHCECSTWYLPTGRRVDPELETRVVIDPRPFLYILDEYGEPKLLGAFHSFTDAVWQRYKEFRERDERQTVRLQTWMDDPGPRDFRVDDVRRARRSQERRDGLAVEDEDLHHTYHGPSRDSFYRLARISTTSITPRARTRSSATTGLCSRTAVRCSTSQ